MWFWLVCAVENSTWCNQNPFFALSLHIFEKLQPTGNDIKSSEIAFSIWIHIFPFGIAYSKCCQKIYYIYSSEMQALYQRINSGEKLECMSIQHFVVNGSGKVDINIFFDETMKIGKCQMLWNEMKYQQMAWKGKKTYIFQLLSIRSFTQFDRGQKEWSKKQKKTSATMTRVDECF